MRNSVYVKARKDGHRAINAYRMATHESIEDAPKEMDGFDLQWEARFDEDDDRDWLGILGWLDEHRDAIGYWKGSNRAYAPKSDGIKIWSVGSRDDVWFIPQYTVEERARDLNKIGYSKSVALDMARAQVAEDGDRMVNGCSYVVTVTALRNGIELGYASVGGVEDDDEDDAILYMAQEDLHLEAIEDAKQSLARLCSDGEC